MTSFRKKSSGFLFVLIVTFHFFRFTSPLTLADCSLYRGDVGRLLRWEAETCGPSPAAWGDAWDVRTVFVVRTELTPGTSDRRDERDPSAECDSEVNDLTDVIEQVSPSPASSSCRTCSRWLLGVLWCKRGMLCSESVSDILLSINMVFARLMSERWCLDVRSWEISECTCEPATGSGTSEVATSTMITGIGTCPASLAAAGDIGCRLWPLYRYLVLGTASQDMSSPKLLLLTVRLLMFQPVFLWMRTGLLWQHHR